MKQESMNIRRVIRANRLLAEQGHAVDTVGALDELAALRKDAERYRKWRAAFTSERDEDVMHKLADAWEPEAVDAVLDAAPDVGAA